VDHDTKRDNGWTEDDSTLFADMGEVFVPAREAQLDTLCRLIPAQPDETFTVAELGAGAGVLARAVLEAYPNCHYLALDGSETMRQLMRERLASFADRIDIRPFALEEAGWREALPQPLRCVLSSLCVHHLSGDGKRQLFANMAARLEPGGALLLADLVWPANEVTRQLYAAQWDEATRERSLSVYGDLSGFQRFRELGWNFFDDPEGDPMDQPSRLFHQLLWLREAGFPVVDCFWMQAGHAIYGGYREE
jgi:SAM-dependent methyltransferase